MIFKFLKKKIYIDFITTSQIAYDYNPIKKSIHFLPDWFKKLPKEYMNDFFPTSTLKRCPGIVDLYKKGMIMPLWSDLALKTESNPTDMRYQFADQESKIEFHDPRQRGAYLPSDKYINFKIISPWLAETKENISWLLAPCTWNYNPFNFHIVKGVINFKYVQFIQVQSFIPFTDSSFIIEQGTPLLQIIPLSDREVEIKTHLVDHNDFEKRKKSNIISFTNSYKKALKKRVLNN